MRDSIGVYAKTGRFSSNAQYLATFLAAIAVLCNLAALAGWAFDLPLLRGFGNEKYPIWPLTATGYLLLGCGLLAGLRDRLAAAALLLALPLAIALLAAVQTLFQVDLGTDRLLFPDRISDYPSQYQGRPGLNSTVLFLLLSAAGYGTILRRRFPEETGGLIATITLALAAAAATLTLLSNPGNPSGRLFSASIPGVLAAFSLAFGFVALHGNFGWVKLMAVDSGRWRILRWIIPAALLLPLVPSICAIVMVERDMLSPSAASALVALANIGIIALIAYWAVRRVAREHATLTEFAEALDHARVALTDMEGRVTHWSSGCQRLYGWSATEAKGRHKYALLRSWCPIPRSGVESDQTELVETHRDGHAMPMIERVRQVAQPGREPILVLELSDISQRVAAIDALKESEERLAAATSAHELGVFEWDVPTGRIEWSPGTEQRLGLIPGSIADFNSWQALADPGDVAEILKTVEAAMQEHADKFSFRYRFRQSNGTVRAVEGSSRMFYDGAGVLTRTVGVMLDVTEREARETTLRGREAQLRSILENVPDPMVVIDQHGTILEFSPAAEALWGHHMHDVLGKSAMILIPDDQRAMQLEGLARVVESGDDISGRVFNARGRTADGRTFPMELRAGVAKIDGATLLTVFVRDLSDQLAAEERLSELNAEIAYVSRQSAMSEVAADLAHELNQPLSATSNFLAAARMLIERGESGDRIVELTRQASEQTQRAGEIIRRLRAFMARGEVEMRTESLERTVRDAVDLVLVGTGLLQTRVSYALDPAVPLIFADRIQVQQVLVNLLRNSIEALRVANQKDRHITISSQKLENDMVEVSVTDNGPGIPGHVLERMFTRFTTTKSGGSGMGIGLSISKRIIEAHGGNIRAENKPEGGASFSFTLPAEQEDQE